MRLDVRIPIGLMFTALGILLTGYGAATLGGPGTAPTGIAINLIWGIVLLAFGLTMLALARRTPPGPSPQSSQSGTERHRGEGE